MPDVALPTDAERLQLTPMTISGAMKFVAEHHRHHPRLVGGLFAVAVSLNGAVRGVAVIGRPVARMANDGWTAEVTRLCTLGDKNACSMLYAASWRAAKALGYRRLITYTLATEPGTSLRAAGWKLTGETGGGSWSRPSRARIDKHPTELKLRWEAA